MKQLSLLTLVFAILSTVFFLPLIFFRLPFVLYPLMSYQDALDLLTLVVRRGLLLSTNSVNL